MPLINKFLRYSPEITLEIFTLVYNKLVDLKWAPNEMMSIRTMWKEFDVFPFLCDLGYSGMKLFGTFSASRYNDTEITVQEILGYNPFVKDDFVLPEKWFIRCTNESKRLLDKWTGFTFKYINIYYDGEDRKTHSDNIIPGYIEITFEQFQKYVLKTTEQPQVMETKVESKSIEKWSAGSYVVAINDGHAIGKSEDKYKVGFIDVITNKFSDETTGLKFSSNCCNKSDFQWFATLQEAEMFAKNLIQPVKEEVKQPLKQAVHCKTQEEWDFVTEKLGYKWTSATFRKDDYCINLTKLETSPRYWWESKGYQILSFQEWCDLNGYKMEKEVKFEVGKWYKYEKWYIKYLKHDDGIWTASEYINDTKSYRNYKTRFGGSNSDSKKVLISLEEIQQYLPDKHPDKIKVDREFKIGDYIFVMIKGKNFGDISKVTDSFIEKKSNYSGVWINHKPSSFGGGGFRLNGNGYIYGEDVRHATPEEINNHLSSIGQISDLIKQEPEKYPFKPLKPGDLEWEIQVPQIKTHGIMWCEPAPMTKDNWKNKMILSIDNEELPMVSIIKTNTIKQLLNND